MADETCDRCGVGDRDATKRAPGTGAEIDRWIDESPAVDAILPDDVRAAMGRFLGDDSIETLADCVAEIRRQTGGESLDVADLCRVDGPSSHRGVVDGETYHFECFYDAVVLAELVDSPVDVHTESPDGTVVEARATGSGGLAVTPADAVLSFGIDRGVDPPADGGPTPAEFYAAACPYVRAFPDRPAYEEWAATVPAATVGLPLADATEVAALFAA